ncbi:hypothetical protein ABEU20_001730 [Rhodococcus sp. PAM 2766]|uniref:Uncharacterized protein n=1 Tax=Rhodococcus parequi TaxID=3137122 RepID=A0ABW9FD26_9NOCA
MTKNLLRTLERMRPDDDALWPADQRAAVCARVMADVSAPPAPRRRSRRVASVVTVAALVVAGGVGAAAASGVMPKAFTDTFYYWRDRAPGETPVDPAVAKRIGSIPGPDGTVFTVLVAHGTDGERCVAPVFETAASAAMPGPSEFSGTIDRCRRKTDTAAFGEGAGTWIVGAIGAGADTDERLNAHYFDAAAGAAVRADLRTSTGQVLPTVFAEGSFFGWYPIPSLGSSTLTGYAADGSIVGSIEIGSGF